MVSYAEAVVIHKYPKNAAYTAYVNEDIKDVYNAISRLERSAEYKAIVVTITEDSNFQLDKKISKVRTKYVDLIEKNLDSMTKVFDNAAESSDPADLARAVRLGNETITAMSIIDGPKDGGHSPKGNLNKSSVIS